MDSLAKSHGDGFSRWEFSFIPTKSWVIVEHLQYVKLLSNATVMGSLAEKNSGSSG